MFFVHSMCIFYYIVYDFIVISVLSHAAEHPIPFVALFFIDYLCIAFNMSKYLISLNIGLLDMHAPFFDKVTSKRAWLGTGPDSPYKYPPRFHNVTPTTDSQYKKGTQVVEIHFLGWIFSCLSYIKSPFV